MFFTGIRITFKILEWLIAYIIEMIKGDPELADLVRKNKLIFMLAILVSLLFVSNCWQYYNFIKADDALKKLLITTEAINGQHHVLSDEHARTLGFLGTAQKRISFMEEDAKADAKTLADAKAELAKKDHIISELMDTKDTEIHKRLVARLNELSEEP